MTQRMPVAALIQGLEGALKRGDGYIFGATGQNPKNWKSTAWWFTQYTNASQKAKALYWREHAARVWDCNGLAEGLYKDYTGVDIDTQARKNYANWCDPKGSGMIPAQYRVPGAAVFWSSSGAGSIHHVAYLYKPVVANQPSGDWYIIEARGVMYGVVQTKLLSRKPNYWGLMTKYFDYGEAGATGLHLGDRVLKNGMEGTDVKELQTHLIELGYDCGSYGADGEFGDMTEMAVRALQTDAGIAIDGVLGAGTLDALNALLAKRGAPENPRHVEISGGNCYVRTAGNTSGKALGVAYRGDRLIYGGQTDPETGWYLVEYTPKGASAAVNGWVSCKYGRLVE